MVSNKSERKQQSSNPDGTAKTKIAIAKQAREDAKKIRSGKPVVLQNWGRRGQRLA